MKGGILYSCFKNITRIYLYLAYQQISIVRERLSLFSQLVVSKPTEKFFKDMWL